MKPNRAVNCSVPNCKTTNIRNVATFNMPKSGWRRKKWLEFLNKNGKQFTPDQEDKKIFKVCELHFEEHLVVESSYRRELESNAFPTLSNENKVRSKFVIRESFDSIECPSF